MKNDITPKRRRRWVPITIFSILGAALIVIVIYAYYFSLWSYIPIFNNPSNENTGGSSESLFATSEPDTDIAIVSITPEYTPESTIGAVSATTTPVPEVLINPGVRDGKFTDGEVIIDEMTYASKDIYIDIQKHQSNILTYFVADIYLRDMANFQSYLSYGINDTSEQITSEMLEQSGGILAISGDFYIARQQGIIIRNGELLRDASSPRGTLAVYENGFMEFLPDRTTAGQELLDKGAQQAYYFGPTLLLNGQAIDDFNGMARLSVQERHPRCAIGMIEPYHFVFVVVDGRTPGYSQGVTLVEFSEIIEGLGCQVAYNLDGGGSATMVFMDKLINLPLGSPSERPISDSVIITESTD